MSSVKILVNPPTILPLINGFPDYSSIPADAVSYLQPAFDLGQYEIIPDPEPEPLQPTDPNWAALTNSLRGTSVFAKAVNTAIANGFTLLLQSLTSLHNEADLQFAIYLVRLGLVEDFTAEEIAFINQLLEANNFLTRIT